MDPNRRRSLYRAIAATLVLLALLLFLTPVGSVFRNQIFGDRSETEKHPTKNPDRPGQPNSHQGKNPTSLLQARSWDVPADIAFLLTEDLDPSNDDPFGPPFAPQGPYDVQIALQSQQIPFTADSWARINLYKGILEVRNLPENLDLIDAVLSNLEPMNMWVMDRGIFDHHGETFRFTIEEIERKLEILKTERKLKNLVIPIIDFESISVREALVVIATQSKEIDIDEPVPAKRGVRFQIIERNNDQNDLLSESDFPALPDRTVRDFRLRNAPIATTLQSICDSSRSRYTVEPGLVILAPLSPTGRPKPGPTATESWHVAPELMDSLRNYLSRREGSDDDNPFVNPKPTRLSFDRSNEDRQVPKLDDLLAELSAWPPLTPTVDYTPERSEFTITDSEPSVRLVQDILESLAFTLSKERHQQSLSE